MHITLHGKNHTCRIGMDGLQLLLTISKFTKQQYAKILTQIGIARKRYKIFEKQKIFSNRLVYRRRILLYDVFMYNVVSTFLWSIQCLFFAVQGIHEKLNNCTNTTAHWSLPQKWFEEIIKLSLSIRKLKILDEFLFSYY